MPCFRSDFAMPDVNPNPYPSKKILAGIVLQALLPAAHAGSLMVNSDADPISGNALSCASGNANTCSLRDALATAGTGDTIGFSSDMTIVLKNNHSLTLSSDVTITGSGHSVVLDGNHVVPVVKVNQGVAATLDHLGIQHGSGVGGGGIFNMGVLTLSYSTVVDNNYPVGAGIYNSGSITISNTTIARNWSGGAGGGIVNRKISGSIGSLTLIDSTVSGNRGVWGGAIANYDGNVDVTNSTLSGNDAGDGADVRNNHGNVTIVNSTLAGNRSSAGAGLSTIYGTTSLANTIVADGCTGGAITDLGGNLDSGATCAFTSPSSSSNAALDLGPLQYNGGNTQTMLPGAASVALDSGLDSVCSSVRVGNQDQRGVSRPQGAHCDTGAVEVAGDAIFAGNFGDK